MLPNEGPGGLKANVPLSSVLLTWISKASSSPRHKSCLLRYHRCHRVHSLQCPVGWERWGAPVRLVEVDVKRPCPVGKDSLLCDEAVVTAPTPTLMGNVHGALVRTTWLVIVVGDGVMLRLPVVAEREERQLTFYNALMSHLSFIRYQCFSLCGEGWGVGDLDSFACLWGCTQPNLTCFKNF